MINKMVGNRLTDLRKERGQTRAYMAKRLELPYSTLCAYERGARNVPDTVKIKIAQYFGMSVGDLFFPNENHET